MLHTVFLFSRNSFLDNQFLAAGVGIFLLASVFLLFFRYDRPFNLFAYCALFGPLFIVLIIFYVNHSFTIVIKSGSWSVAIRWISTVFALALLEEIVFRKYLISYFIVNKKLSKPIAELAPVKRLS
jgi:membrane protease YdiL (CAAX protease family)